MAVFRLLANVSNTQTKLHSPILVSGAGEGENGCSYGNSVKMVYVDLWVRVVGCRYWSSK